VKDQQEKPAKPSVERALSHPERFEMLDCIKQRKTGVSEGELADALGLSRAKVRYHLTVLRNAELVERPDSAGGRYVAVVKP